MRYVMKPDGSMHMESDVGTMRFDLTDGSVSTVLGNGVTSNGIHSVFSQDSSASTEWQSGNMRFTMGQPGFDFIIKD